VKIISLLMDHEGFFNKVLKANRIIKEVFQDEQIEGVVEIAIAEEEKDCLKFFVENGQGVSMKRCLFISKREEAIRDSFRLG